MRKPHLVSYARADGATIALEIPGKVDPFVLVETIAALLYPDETPEQIRAGAARADAVLKRHSEKRAA